MAKVLIGNGGPPTEFARQVAEADIGLLRIRKIRVSYFNAIVGNPDAPPQAYAELAENLAKLDVLDPVVAANACAMGA